jgi:hypothetical protein
MAQMIEYLNRNSISFLPPAVARNVLPKPKTVLIIIATTLYLESGKFFKSEKADYDIGFERALLDWTTKYRSAWNEKRHRQSMKPGWFVIDPDIARGPAVASLARKRPLWASTDQHFSI